jgi:hypothetical protein
MQIPGVNPGVGDPEEIPPPTPGIPTEPPDESPPGNPRPEIPPVIDDPAEPGPPRELPPDTPNEVPTRNGCVATAARNDVGFHPLRLTSIHSRALIRPRIQNSWRIDALRHIAAA